jgi:hypothetical protein
MAYDFRRAGAVLCYASITCHIRTHDTTTVHPGVPAVVPDQREARRGCIRVLGSACLR